MSVLAWHFQPDGNGEIVATPTDGPSVSLAVRFEDFQRIVVNDLREIFHAKTVADGDASHGSIDLAPAQSEPAAPEPEPSAITAEAPPIAEQPAAATTEQEQAVGQTDTPSA